MFENLGPFINVFLGILVVFLVFRRVFGLLGKTRGHSPLKLSIPNHWRTTEGEVIAAVTKKIERPMESAEDEENDEVLYFPIVEFAYTVKGKRYTGHQAFARPNSNTESVNSSLADYPVGMELLVYYDPQNPTRARFSME